MGRPLPGFDVNAFELKCVPIYSNTCPTNGRSLGLTVPSFYTLSFIILSYSAANSAASTSGSFAGSFGLSVAGLAG